MDYPEDIDLSAVNLGVASWVEKTILTSTKSNSYKIIGCSLDGWRGFGNQYDSSYLGKAIFISSFEKSIHDVYIYSSHVSNKGWMWNIETDGVMPEHPFLISSRLNLDIIFNGYIHLLPDRAIEDLRELNGNDFSSPVIVNAIDFGLLTVKEKSIHLLIFSDSEKELFIEGVTLQFPGNDCVIGWAIQSFTESCINIADSEEMMYVKKIWIENEDETSEELIYPSWEQISSALNMMDGNGRNTIVLYPDINDEVEDPEFMSICGGENNLFVCSVYHDDGSESYLININEVSEETVTFYTGQSSLKPKNQIVNLTMTIQVARTYVETGELDSTLTWHNV
jgi:hypothetical protein